MKTLTENQRHTIDILYEIGVFKFGQFTLKGGLVSPVYVDLRLIVSYPVLLQELAGEIKHSLENEKLTSDCVCGVPYAALPVATCYSVGSNVPMLIMRKEVKSYGTSKQVEGVVKQGDKCLIIEDTVTSGASIAQVAKTLRQHGLVVNDAIVILDRNQGAEDQMKKIDVKLHSIFNLTDIVGYLREMERIDVTVAESVLSFLAQNQAQLSANGPVHSLQRMPFDQRSHKLKHVRALMLAGIMKDKKTNLCLSADLTDTEAILDLVKTVGSEICLLKLHSDAISNFSAHFVAELKSCAKNLKFLIMEDRKFADIGNTVRQQLTDGPTKIAEWAHLVTVHAVAGTGTLMGLQAACNEHMIGCLIVREMSSEDALCNKEEYATSCVQMAQQYRDIVAGYICQKRTAKDDDAFIFMTPGVNASHASDALKQQYRQPHQAIVDDGNDVVIVGRGIFGAADPLASARRYKEAAWEALRGEQANL